MLRNSCTVPYLFISIYLHNQHGDEDEDERSVEVGDIEGGSEPADEGVAADDGSQEHGGQLGAEIRHQTGTDQLQLVAGSAVCTLC